jgi:hypothetical protein
MTKKFVVLLRDDGFLDRLGPGEIGAVLARYKAWTQKVPRVGGQKLKVGGGRVLRGDSVTDGPYAESKEMIGGLTILEADSYEDVIGFCRDHPHLDYGSIEIREVDQI